MKAGNLMIVQGGGPTPVFNASLASIIAEGIAQPGIGRIYGAQSGMKGMAEERFIDLTDMSSLDIGALRNSPGAALGSSRFKPTDEDLERSVGYMRKRDIRHLIFMGGDGSMRGAELVREFCRGMNFDVQIMGVPKTIDNDIVATDRCPGFGSAARYVAQSTRDLGMDLRSLSQPVSIFETLGRNVGWLTASASLAKTGPDDAPHLVYVPEMAFSLERFLADLDAVVRRIGWAVVVVSEGISYADGTPVFEQRIASQNGAVNRPLIGGVAQYLSGVVAENLGIRCRSEKPGLIGRACRALVSAQDQADAELVGREGVRALISGETDKMVSLRPLGEESAAFELIPLHKTAGKHRAIPAEWLSDGPLAITSEFLDYVRPQVGELFPYLPFLQSQA
jgi:ATP-dependent phosphofructokinase / diphosphate-dependent phosphofructokinase